MKILIVCSGNALQSLGLSYDSSGFDNLCQLSREQNIQAFECKKLQVDGRSVYISTWKSARQTAELLMDDAVFSEELLLDEIPQRSYKDSVKPLPLWRWLMMAQVQRRLGNARQPESSAQARDRADKLIDLLETRGQDCILVSHPLFLKILLERFKARGYCAARSGVFSINPLERILITRRDMHCGGCQHNCLLTNPGCGVGRDKAQRHSG